MKKTVIGIASQDEIRARALAIARGEYKPATDEPKIWFTSIRSLADANERQDNLELVKLVRKRRRERRTKITLDKL